MALIEERLERQLLIKGWNQVALENARVGVVGDDDLLASLFALSAAALGINDLVVIAPMLEKVLINAAMRINPRFNLTFLEGFYTHPALNDLFAGCKVIADLSLYGLGNKLLVNKAYRDGTPVVRSFVLRSARETGFRIFTYMKGREWEELESVVSQTGLPGKHPDDGVMDTIASGVALDEVKNILMGWKVTPELISYSREDGAAPMNSSPRILVIGAGALGNFAGLGLAYSGIKDITFIDPDLIEVANLNRQIFFYDAVGRGKAKTLAQRLNEGFGTFAKYLAGDFNEKTDISGYDVIFDCVDNFETRVLISERCRADRKVLISGGTSHSAGQVTVYDPAAGGPTPSELLGINEIVRTRKAGSSSRVRQSCRNRPDPSVIMTNQIIAGFMVDAVRVLLTGGKPDNIFYNSESEEKILR